MKVVFKFENESRLPKVFDPAEGWMVLLDEYQIIEGSFGNEFYTQDFIIIKKDRNQTDVIFNEDLTEYTYTLKYIPQTTKSVLNPIPIKEMEEIINRHFL